MCRIIKYNPWETPKKESYIEPIKVGNITVGFQWKRKLCAKKYTNKDIESKAINILKNQTNIK